MAWGGDISHLNHKSPPFSSWVPMGKESGWGLGVCLLLTITPQGVDLPHQRVWTGDASKRLCQEGLCFQSHSPGWWQPRFPVNLARDIKSLCVPQRKKVEEYGGTGGRSDSCDAVLDDMSHPLCAIRLDRCESQKPPYIWEGWHSLSFVVTS